MKKLFLPLLISMMLSCENKPKETQEEGFQIAGTIAGADSSWIVFQKLQDGEWIKLDSAQSETFSFSGKVDQPEMYYIAVGDEGRISFFTENSNINIEGHADSLKKVKISGSKLQETFNEYNKGLEEYYDKMRALYPEYDKANTINDEKRIAELDAQYEKLDKEQKEYTKSVIAKNLSNPLAPYLTTRLYYTDDNLEELDSIYNQFDPSIKSSIYTQKVEEMINTWEKVAVGQPAVDFTQNGTTGTPVSLNELKGKYVLIDFWASWCGPCREENPNVVAMYNDLHDKGFEIIGVSFDTKEENWKKAIKDDKLTWYHVSDLKGWKNEVGQTYGVQAIPHTVLLDKEGVIIAKNLRGEELRAKLEELLM